MPRTLALFGVLCIGRPLSLTIADDATILLRLAVTTKLPVCLHSVERTLMRRFLVCWDKGLSIRCPRRS